MSEAPRKEMRRHGGVLVLCSSGLRSSVIDCFRKSWKRQVSSGISSRSKCLPLKLLCVISKCFKQSASSQTCISSFSRTSPSLTPRSILLKLDTIDSVSNNTEMCEITQYSRMTVNEMMAQPTRVCIHANKMMSAQCWVCMTCTAVSATEMASCNGTAVKVSMKITAMIIREHALKPCVMIARPSSPPGVAKTNRTKDPWNRTKSLLKLAAFNVNLPAIAKWCKR
mmetsp:Transcript_78554/g.173363  ORF Transcript_78554/g.173363 Transcript_78554/m.173363 type:complete len:225 (-) Transcript_78554:444-1118(-)